MENKRKLFYMVLGCMGLGILFDILFWGKVIGVSVPIFIIVFYILFILTFKEKLEFKLNFAWLLSIPIIALSFTYLIFSNMIFMILNVIAIPFLIVVQTILLTKSNRYEWYTKEFLKDFFGIVIEESIKNVPEPFRVISKNIEVRSNKKYEVPIKIAIGLGISIPIIFVVMNLLSSADQVFGYYMGNVLNLFTKFNMIDFIPQGIAIFFIALASSCYLITIYKRYDIKKEDVLENKNMRFIDPVILVTILSIINIVYILFTLVQFSYLFGNLTFALPPNFTYADYARRGFFELVLVTLINLSIILVNINFTKMGKEVITKFIKVFNSILIICTLVMLISAHLRMSLYEAAYGYTYLRILTHSFMVFIFMLLLVACAKVWREKVALSKSYIIITIIAYLIVNYINIDEIIIEKNIERYNQNGQIDIVYLTNLSYDAMPTLLNFIKENPKIKDEYQKSSYRFGEYNSDELKYKKENLEKEKDWQSFNISKFRAKNAFQVYEK